MSFLFVFPALKTSAAFKITSQPDEHYNCIAWSVGDMKNWWWPNRGFSTNYWPEGIPAEETIEAFSSAFRSKGYDECESVELEDNLEKIALYARSGAPKHAARQLENGFWTSKLGKGEDIQHELADLEGDFYGRVVRIFCRVRKE
ncbi:MAG: hypothetical protein WAM82_09525 [Thermoanaerobaculia bacterium]